MLCKETYGRKTSRKKNTLLRMPPAASYRKNTNTRINIFLPLQHKMMPFTRKFLAIYSTHGNYLQNCRNVDEVLNTNK